jgi:hypothetical protein
VAQNFRGLGRPAHTLIVDVARYHRKQQVRCPCPGREHLTHLLALKSRGAARISRSKPIFVCAVPATAWTPEADRKSFGSPGQSETDCLNHVSCTRDRRTSHDARTSRERTPNSDSHRMRASTFLLIAGTLMRATHVLAPALPHDDLRWRFNFMR